MKNAILFFSALLILWIAACSKPVCTDVNALIPSLQTGTNPQTGRNSNYKKENCQFSHAIFFYLADSGSVTRDTILPSGIDSFYTVNSPSDSSKIPFILFIDNRLVTKGNGDTVFINKILATVPDVCGSIPGAYVDSLPDGGVHNWVAITNRGKGVAYYGTVQASAYSNCIQVPIR